MRAAVRGWSPVIMITRMPARRASAMAAAGLGSRRIDHAHRADEDQVPCSRSCRRRRVFAVSASGR